jgi:hypothetical protein
MNQSKEKRVTGKRIFIIVDKTDSEFADKLEKIVSDYHSRKLNGAKVSEKPKHDD